MSNADARLVAIFKTLTIENETKSKEAGRPIFDEMEVCEIRFAGDRNRVSVFPAHDYTTSEVNEDGTERRVTYAERFSENYKRFKAKKAQVKDGTPLDELTFLSEKQRSELRALNVYTAEDLADLDGQPLKNLGPGGRDLKVKASAYISRAADAGLVDRLQAQNEALERRLAELEKERDVAQTKATAVERDLRERETGTPDVDFEKWSVDELKDWIKSESGTAPRGNPGHETLVAMAREINSAKAG